MVAIADFGLLQIIGIAFAVFALSRAVLRYKDKTIRTTELLFWALIWAGVIGVAIFPEIFVSLSRILGIGRGVDILLYFGMILLFYLFFRLYVKVETQQREMTALVREIALNSFSSQKKAGGKFSRNKKEPEMK